MYTSMQYSGYKVSEKTILILHDFWYRRWNIIIGIPSTLTLVVVIIMLYTRVPSYIVVNHP